ncbi:glutamate racemase [Fulvivirga sedimenti]|uniref:Glutamate racemase n=1 Tax=Fulvivirga sedimenti TaxID=2879465 RepID=A0A9X1HPF5_9BACT|nr:glutamate racemase [Fulvivirga sedimenti]MCA6075401.1 glutamate racemase [Fulvivirga sedimenti]MCA6076578.1 glutamate racemase [Fulvivirga sedimenti]MCA6077706.1 glutamate racemase [Fulvivirga sedimenti]
MNTREHPIGIFDSGIGGLTVAHAIKELMPRESLIYFGDTAHLPYGDKSEAAIQAYSVKIADVLLQRGCKAIVIACNSASSSAYELLKEYVGSKALVVNVIDPMIEHVRSNFPDSNIGLIGTRRTVDSKIYATRIAEVADSVHLSSLATPLLVPMIEEGFFDNRISSEIIATYLDDPSLADIQAIILGCTHYPLIRQQIDAYYGGGVSVLDSSLITALHLKDLLEEKDMLCEKCEGEDEFLVSDYTESFQASTRLFFGEKVRLTNYRLWE